MELVIDIGNSRTKIGIFQNDALSEVLTTEKLTPGSIQKLLVSFPAINKVIYSSVKEVDSTVSETLHSFKKTIQLSHNTPVPFINKYETPKTLGKDRIAAVAGGMTLFKNQNCLIIDAGTCITYDVVTKDKIYLGGGISPGINMRFEAMHTFTGKLPLVKSEPDKKVKLIGTTTISSIESGARNGVLAEVDGIIDLYKKQFANLKVVVTGGDYNYFDKYLKNNIFAAPNLVLIGLKKILEFNEDI